jgi:hypothetical protein
MSEKNEVLPILDEQTCKINEQIGYMQNTQRLIYRKICQISNDVVQDEKKGLEKKEPSDFVERLQQINSELSKLNEDFEYLHNKLCGLIK